MPKPNADHPWGRTHVRRNGVSHVVRAPEAIAALLSSVATLSYREAAVLHDLTIGTVASYVRAARRRGLDVVTRPRPEPVARKRTPREPKPFIVRAVASDRPVRGMRVKPVPPYHSGVGFLDVGRRQCRSLDDAGECCAAPTVGASSWCAAHRLKYVAVAA